MNIDYASYSYSLNAYSRPEATLAAAGRQSLEATASSASLSLQLSGSYLELKGGAGAGDSLSVSATARELSERLKELDVFKIIFPDSDPRRKAKTLEEIESDFLGDFSAFSDTWRGLVSSLKLEPGQSFVMGLDGVGGMTVEGDAMAGQVGRLFNDSSVAVARFAVMAARAALVDAADTLEGFKDDYNSDPFAAVKDHIDGLKERLLGFRVQTGGAEAAYGFMRDFELEISASASSLAVGAA